MKEEEEKKIIGKIWLKNIILQSCIFIGSSQCFIYDRSFCLCQKLLRDKSDQ
jgi:hypothetical protein